MATAPTIYQKRQATRRATADIERLGKQYQTGLLDVTQQQQNAFTEWQKSAAAQMAPYEASVKQYTNVAFPAYQRELQSYNQQIQTYEQQAAAYRARLNAFQVSLMDFERNLEQEAAIENVANQEQKVTKTVPIGSGLVAQVRAELERLEAAKNVPSNDGVVAQVRAELERIERVSNRVVPTFTEQPPAPPSVAMPKAPTPPGAPPDVGSLDVTPFEQQRGQLESTFKRELGERKAAKQNVVMRRIGRPMLQET